MTQKFTATSSLEIQAEPEEIWAALTDLELMSQAFFGATVETDWQSGSPITFEGQWQGKPFRDHGEIVTAEPGKTLRFTHFSPMSGQPDEPDNYHVLTFELTPHNGGTQVRMSQTNAASEQERDHSESMWTQVLSTLKQLVER